MSLKQTASRLLHHPLTVGMHVDDPLTTERRRVILQNKKFLRHLYAEWYDLVRARVPQGPGDIVELGSGAGFMKDFIPDLITTDVLLLDGIDHVLKPGENLPFADQSLKAIVMTDVLHHMAEVRVFFNEATRVVRTGGAVVMIEPWVTGWSTFIYRHLHSEPFKPDAPTWFFPTSGPLSGANGALPWRIFDKDRGVFEREFPAWSISRIEPMMPFAYLLSGGISMRSLCPGWMYKPVRCLERALGRRERRMAMFAVITLTKGSS